MGFVFFDPSAVFAHPNSQAVHANNTITTSGSSVLALPYGMTSVVLAVNVKNSPTGTTPTLTFSLQDVDPGDKTTLFGSADSGSALNSISTQIVEHASKTGYIKISWTIGGTGSPTFTGVYSTVVGIIVEPTSLGQKAMAASTPVTVSSDQAAFPVTANAGTNLNTSALALDATLTSGSQKTQVVSGSNALTINGSGQAAIQNPPNLDVASSTLATSANQTNGNQISILKAGAKGTTVAALVTSNPIDANTQALHVDGSKVTQPISAASLPLPTGASTEASLAKLTLTQGSTTSGQSGPIIQGAVTTSAPSYSTGQTSPLSLTTVGALRVDGSGATQPVSGTITANQGTSASLANAWALKITDTTNGPVAVKPASTPAVASDPSLVVTPSPNGTFFAAVKQPAGSVTVELAYDQTVAVAGAQSNQFFSALNYTVPASYKFAVALLTSTSADNKTTTRVAKYMSMGSWNIGTQVFTSSGSSYTTPAFASYLEAEVTTATGGSNNVTLTITYTNQDGTTGRTATAVIPKNTPVGYKIDATLQGTDYGVLSVQSVSQTSTNTGVVQLKAGVEFLTYVVGTATTTFAVAPPDSSSFVANAGDIIELAWASNSAATAERQVKVVGVLIPS